MLVQANTSSDPAAKGAAKDLEVAGAGPVHCHFPFPPSFLIRFSSERCLSNTSLFVLSAPFPCAGSAVWVERTTCICRHNCSVSSRHISNSLSRQPSTRL